MIDRVGLEERAVRALVEQGYIHDYTTYGGFEITKVVFDAIFPVLAAEIEQMSTCPEECAFDCPKCQIAMFVGGLGR